MAVVVAMEEEATEATTTMEGMEGEGVTWDSRNVNGREFDKCPREFEARAFYERWPLASGGLEVCKPVLDLRIESIPCVCKGSRDAKNVRM